MDPGNNNNLIHAFGNESSAKIGKVRKEEKASSAPNLIHPIVMLQNSKTKLSDDELSLCCENYIEGIGLEVCSNPDNGKETKCDCLAQLVEDEDVKLAAVMLLKVHSRRDDKVRKEFVHEWERNALICSIFEQKRKKRKDPRKKFKGERKRGRVYSLSAVFDKDGTPYLICRNAFMKFFGIG